MKLDKHEWREDGVAWRISDFFEVLRNEFRTLRAVPLSSCVVAGSDWEGQAELVALAAAIFREHGWPDEEKYRKEECIPAVMRAVMKEFPDLYLDGY